MNTVTHATLRPRFVALVATLTALGALAAGCADTPSSPAASRGVGAVQAGAGQHRQYGAPVRLGEGRARSYVLLDERAGGRTIELGVALDERAMEGLRAPDPSHGEHEDHDMLLLPLPARNATAFQLVELDWNPRGHGAPHAEPHFDFHFYTISRAEREAIVPGDPQYAARAAHEPPAASRPAFFANPVALLGIPAEAVAVPMMGMHWIDTRSPELQGLFGNPEGYRPFTATFIYGAWDGQFIFMEPMITRAYIMAKRDATDPAVRDEVIPISTSPAYPAGGFRPDAYRITYDARAREYRVALTLRAL
jgi:hypothetical protein